MREVEAPEGWLLVSQQDLDAEGCQAKAPEQAQEEAQGASEQLAWSSCLEEVSALAISLVYALLVVAEIVLVVFQAAGKVRSLAPSPGSPEPPQEGARG